MVYYIQVREMSLELEKLIGWMWKRIESELEKEREVFPRFSLVTDQSISSGRLPGIGELEAWEMEMLGRVRREGGKVLLMLGEYSLIDKWRPEKVYLLLAAVRGEGDCLVVTEWKEGKLVSFGGGKDIGGCWGFCERLRKEIVGR